VSLPVTEKQRAKIRADAAMRAKGASLEDLRCWIDDISLTLALPGVSFAERLALNEERHALREAVDETLSLPLSPPSSPDIAGQLRTLSE